jgi:glutamyl/glutaminyl-tRNA synthetase
MVNSQFFKTRIAPTPSGFLHLGNVLSFALTAALAEKTDAKILLRIDDLDQARVNRQYLNDVFDTLNFLEIAWHEGPLNVDEFEHSYSQLHRISSYHKALQQLGDAGLVFACTCSRLEAPGCYCRYKHIPLSTVNTSWRFITDNQTGIAVKNYHGEIINATLPAEMKNFIVKKKDGLPAYQLTSIIDDISFGVDLIIRGIDLWPSTLAQHQLAKALNQDKFKEITFFHHSLLMEAEGKKLSKSAGSTSIKNLRERGKTPADIYGIIAAMLSINEPVTNWQQLTKTII